jgi:hypothetical protein
MLVRVVVVLGGSCRCGARLSWRRYVASLSDQIKEEIGMFFEKEKYYTTNNGNS